MIEGLIALSIRRRVLVLMTALLLLAAGIWSMRHTPLDALPDLSAPQVIVQVSWQGQSPDIIEAQGTYPLVSQFLSIADIQTVRAFSTYENALIYIIFNDGTDLYWARARVLEQLSTLQGKLPQGVEVSLGPDASGVGWAYEYALTSGTKNLAELRTLQDYYFKYALMGVDGVSDVASVGGFIPTYQLTVNNDALIRYGLSIADVTRVLRNNNNDTGGRIVIQNGFEWMVQAKGYLKDLKTIGELVATVKNGIPVTLAQLGHLEIVPAARRGVADLNGQGEVVGGIVMVRDGEDVYRVIQRVKEKLASLKIEGVNIVPVYDRSALIEKAVGTLKRTLIEESIIVVLVIALFLMHLRSSLIVLITLPLVIGMTFALMKLFGIGSNIMSLGGIAIALGTVVDASIVMIENVHKKLTGSASPQPLSDATRIGIIIEASQQVGRPIFFALVLVVISFLPIFALGGEEGLLFTPLAFTKTFAMAAGALLAITLVPALMVYLVKDGIKDERANPLNRFFLWLYRPVLVWSIKLRYVVLAGALALLALAVPLYEKLNWEFMPSLNEQTFMYMPVTPFGIGIDQSKALTQQTDHVIKSFPEVQTVFGKGGRADTATDPAPLGMLETIITFKEPSQWREGMTYDTLRAQMNEALQIPGLINAWTYPIRGRIDMLLSGIRTPVGLKLYGNDTETLQRVSGTIEQTLATLPESASVFADRTATGYYIDIDINASALARYGLTSQTLLDYTRAAIGGMKVTMLYHGIERYPVALRLKADERRTPEAIRAIAVKTPLGFVPLGTFASVQYRQSASVIKSEMATPVTYVYITPREGVSATAYTAAARDALQNVTLPPGVRMEWAGQSESLDAALRQLAWIIPLVALSILILIYVALRRLAATLIVFLTLPFALLGGLACVWLLGFSMSIAVIVGFLALLGIAAETAIVMIVYLEESVEVSRRNLKAAFNERALNAAIFEGALKRVRPKLMTVFSILAGLAPIMLASGVGSEVMRRIAAPMLGGIITSAALSLIVIPVLYKMIETRTLRKHQ